MAKEPDITDIMSNGVIALIWVRCSSMWMSVKNHNDQESLPWTFKQGTESSEEALNRLIRKSLYMSKSEPFSKRMVTVSQNKKGYSFSYYFVTLNSHCIQFAGDFKLVSYCGFDIIEDVLKGGEYPKEFSSIVGNKKIFY